MNGVYRVYDDRGNVHKIIFTVASDLIGMASAPTPTLLRVPLADVRELLPAGTATVTPAERAASVRQRVMGHQMRRRW